MKQESLCFSFLSEEETRKPKSSLQPSKSRRSYRLRRSSFEEGLSKILTDRRMVEAHRSISLKIKTRQNAKRCRKVLLIRHNKTRRVKAIFDPQYQRFLHVPTMVAINAEMVAFQQNKDQILEIHNERRKESKSKAEPQGQTDHR